MLDTKIYSKTYVQKQLAKFKNRNNNHWKNRISLAKQLVSNYASLPPATILDLGCSIGTFAIEFSMDGYNTIGIDLDDHALEEGQKLAEELGCQPQWICTNASDFSLDKQVDIVLCFDLLEHLIDEIIIGSLNRVQENLRPGGLFIFYTFPTEYDHVFIASIFLVCLLFLFTDCQVKVLRIW